MKTSEKIIKEGNFDVPINRIGDKHWLLRNVLIRNSDNAMAEDLINQLKKEIRGKIVLPVDNPINGDTLPL